MPILINGVYYKRFIAGSYNTFTLTLPSNPVLQVPYLTLSNSSSGGKISTTSSGATGINYMAFFGILMAIVGVLFIIGFYRYMKYNPDENNDPYYCFKAILLFLIYVIKYVAMGLWVWVLILSAYLFFFYKLQQTVYITLPTLPTDSLYTTFNGFFYVTFTLTIVAIFILMFNLTNSVDYFLIDWEK